MLCHQLHTSAMILSMLMSILGFLACKVQRSSITVMFLANNCKRTGNKAFLEVIEAILAQNALQSQAQVSSALERHREAFQCRSLDVVSAKFVQQEY